MMLRMHPEDVFSPTDPVHTSSMPPSTARAREVFAGRFELEQLAGAGGMGAVWRALDRHSGGPVAVKVMLNRHEDQVARFQREARLLAELRHPGIAQHVDHGVTEDGRHYLVMEWLDGEDLAARLARGPLTADETITLLGQVAEALALVHARGVVHRDLKPANLFLLGGDINRVKVLDFGIAREPNTACITADGLVIGTPAYMAPEQVYGEPDVDARADMFSLGCVIYECLTGRPAFHGPHAMAVLAKVLTCTPVLNIEPESPIAKRLQVLAGLMLVKDREKRSPSDGADLANRIEFLRCEDSAANRFFDSLMYAPPELLGLGLTRDATLRSAGRQAVASPLYEIAALVRGEQELRPILADAGQLETIWLRHLGMWFIIRVRGARSLAAIESICLRRTQGHHRYPAALVIIDTSSRQASPEAEMIDRLTCLLDGALKRKLRGIVVDEGTASLLEPARFKFHGEGDLLEAWPRRVQR